MRRKFDWTKESITNKATGSTWKYHTRAPGTKDGGRPGKVNFDEFHAYENTKLIDVAVTGLGKVPHPRRTIVTTQGDVRDGPLDTTLEKALAILAGECCRLSAAWTATTRPETRRTGTRQIRACNTLATSWTKLCWSTPNGWTILWGIRDL